MPGAFIEYAEVTGLAIPMTLSLMQQVRSDLGELCRDMPDIKVSINLFEGHFRDGTIVEDVQAIFGGSHASASGNWCSRSPSARRSAIRRRRTA